MSAYYNEIDPYSAQWLRNLRDAGLIAPGDVDERSISDVKPNEIAGYTQCHFFAGISVWSYSLRQAGWPDDKPVWTGSCPCQPFSAAGAGKGKTDERHLWPHWFHLVSTIMPQTVFGEQVASPDGLGWLDLVSADLEGAGYAYGVGDLCAAGFGAPHRRQRLFFGAVDPAKGLALAHDEGPQGHGRSGEVHAQTRRETSSRCGSASSVLGGEREWLWLPDGLGFHRAFEPGTSPVDNGSSGRVGRIRAYGNAIDTRAATGFIETFVDAYRDVERSFGPVVVEDLLS